MTMTEDCMLDIYFQIAAHFLLIEIIQTCMSGFSLFHSYCFKTCPYLSGA